MAELDRTFTEELFTEVLESTPCIIVYSQQAFECSKNYLKSTTQTAKEISNLSWCPSMQNYLIKERPRKTSKISIYYRRIEVIYICYAKTKSN